MNVTSSLLLGVKPIVRTLMPPEEGRRNGESTLGYSGNIQRFRLVFLGRFVSMSISFRFETRKWDPPQ